MEAEYAAEDAKQEEAARVATLQAMAAAQEKGKTNQGLSDHGVATLESTQRMFLEYLETYEISIDPHEGPTR